MPCGLGARDSLRLEKKFALYGNDIDDTVNPIEAGLGWICKDKSKDFIGADAVRAMRGATKRKLVALLLDKRRIARHGADIIDEAGETVGHVTSGAFGPSAGRSIALAFVPKAMGAIGSRVTILQSGKRLGAEVVKPPFI